MQTKGWPCELAEEFERVSEFFGTDEFAEEFVDGYYGPLSGPILDEYRDKFVEVYMTDENVAWGISVFKISGDATKEDIYQVSKDNFDPRHVAESTARMMAL